MSCDKSIKWKKGIALGMAVLLAFGGTACGKKQDTSKKTEKTTTFESSDMKMDTCIMAVGDEEVTLNEMLFYVYQLKSEYDGALTPEVWQYAYEKDKTIEGYSKEQLVDEIAQIKLNCRDMNLQRKKQTKRT